MSIVSLAMRCCLWSFWKSIDNLLAAVDGACALDVEGSIFEPANHIHIYHSLDASLGQLLGILGRAIEAQLLGIEGYEDDGVLGLVVALSEGASHLQQCSRARSVVVGAVIDFAAFGAEVVVVGSHDDIFAAVDALNFGYDVAEGAVVECLGEYLERGVEVHLVELLPDVVACQVSFGRACFATCQRVACEVFDVAFELIFELLCEGDCERCHQGHSQC